MSCDGCNSNKPECVRILDEFDVPRDLQDYIAKFLVIREKEELFEMHNHLMCKKCFSYMHYISDICDTNLIACSGCGKQTFLSTGR
jgi:hypothetical protein